MTLKPDILEKGESLINNINGRILIEVQPSLKNLGEITGKLNDSLLGDVQKAVLAAHRTEALSRRKKMDLIGL